MVEFNEKKIGESKKGDSFSLKRELSLQFKRILSFVNKVHFNVELQKLFDKCDGDLNDYETAMQDFNINNGGFLATGVSSYFNDQVDRLGLANIRVVKEDRDDAEFVQKRFGNDNEYGSNNLKILYTTLPGTTEVVYGGQPFPAGIYEDVFRFSASHDFDLLPRVGEDEVAYYCRNLATAIDNDPHFPVADKEETLKRAHRLATHFCTGKNRVYLIPISNIVNNKASFGDIKELRNGELKGDDLQTKLDSLSSLLDLTQSQFHSINIDFKNNSQQSTSVLYGNANFFVGERGIAIYGDFSNKGIMYFEVERKYDLMQKKARELGYVDGEEIPNNILSMASKASTK